MFEKIFEKKFSARKNRKLQIFRNAFCRSFTPIGAMFDGCTDVRSSWSPRRDSRSVNNPRGFIPIRVLENPHNGLLEVSVPLELQLLKVYSLLRSLRSRDRGSRIPPRRIEAGVLGLQVGSCWLIFRMFFVSWALFKRFWLVLGVFLRSETIFFKLSSIFHRFIDFVEILERFLNDFWCILQIWRLNENQQKPQKESWFFIVFKDSSFQNSPTN